MSRNILRRMIVLSACLAVMMGTVSAHAETRPDQILKSLWGDVQRLSHEPNPSLRAEQVRSLLRSHYDFESFYATALQDYWPQWSEAQRKDFSGRFEGVFLDSLVRKLTRLPQGGVEMTFESQRISGDHAEVRLKGVKGTKHVGFQVFFMKRDGEWKICDVDIAGALLSRNYRGQFNHILRTQSYDALLAKLDQKKESTGGNL